MAKKSDKTDGNEPGREEHQPDRRRHPRVYEDLPAEAVLADDSTIRLSLQSLGLGGVRLGCSEKEMRRIKNDGHPALHGQTVEIDLRVSLPTYDRAAEKLEATCRLVYTRRITQQRYCLGMQFTDLKGDSREALMRYLLDAPVGPR
jgi:hypothetical protein